MKNNRWKEVIVDPAFKAKKMLEISTTMESENLYDNMSIFKHLKVSYNYFDNDTKGLFKALIPDFLGWFYMTKSKLDVVELYDFVSYNEAVENKTPQEKAFHYKNYPSFKATIELLEKIAIDFEDKKNAFINFYNFRKIIVWIFSIVIGFCFAIVIDKIILGSFIVETFFADIKENHIDILKLVASFLIGKFLADRVQSYFESLIQKRRYNLEIERMKNLIMDFENSYSLICEQLKTDSKTLAEGLEEFIELGRLRNNPAANTR